MCQNFVELPNNIKNALLTCAEHCAKTEDITELLYLCFKLGFDYSQLKQAQKEEEIINITPTNGENYEH